MTTKTDNETFMRLLDTNIQKGMKVEEENMHGQVVRSWKVAGQHQGRTPAKHSALSAYPTWSQGWVLISGFWPNVIKRLVFPEDLAETKYYVLE